MAEDRPPETIFESRKEKSRHSEKDTVKKEIVLDTVFGNHKSKRSDKNESISPQKEAAKKEVVVDSIFSLFGSVVNQTVRDHNGKTPLRRSKSSAQTNRARKRQKSLQRSESLPRELANSRHPMKRHLKGRSLEVPKYESGGPMPDDIKEMIGKKQPSPSKAKNIGATKSRSFTNLSPKMLSPQYLPLSNSSTPKGSPTHRIKKTKIDRKPVVRSGSVALNDKFNEERKRNVISSYLKNPKTELKDLIIKKPKSPIKTIERIVDYKNKEDTTKKVVEIFEENVKDKSNDLEMKNSKEKKANLFNVVIASAAAEAVNLKSKGEQKYKKI